MYFYLTVNVGCVIAFGILATTATNGLPPLIPKKDGYFFTYMVCAACMAVAWLVYMGGTPLYRKESFQTTSDNNLKLFVTRLYNGRDHPLGKVALLGWCMIPALIAMAIVAAFVDSLVLTLLSLILDIVCIACLCVAHRTNDWLGDADGVTQCLDCIPTLLVGNITFNVLYNTMASVFYSEACQMDTRLGSAANSTQLNGAFFNLGDAFAIIVFTPVIDWIIRALQKSTGKTVTLNMKLYAGIAFAVGSQLLAAAFEYARKSAPVLPIPSHCAPLEGDGSGHVHMSGFSAFWMTIPYAMIGIGEVLVNPVLQHTAYEGAPASMRSMLQAFNLFAMGGMPNAVSSGLSLITQQYTPNNLNDGNLPMVYYINAIFAALGCGLYYWVSKARKVTPTKVLENKIASLESNACIEA